MRVGRGSGWRGRGGRAGYSASQSEILPPNTARLSWTACVCVSSAQGCEETAPRPLHPQILRLRDMMKRGVAVHHAGLLPIMKEVVEMLFCQGYIKVGRRGRVG